MIKVIYMAACMIAEMKKNEDDSVGTHRLDRKWNLQ